MIPKKTQMGLNTTCPSTIFSSLGKEKFGCGSLKPGFPKCDLPAWAVSSESTEQVLKGYVKFCLNLLNLFLISCQYEVDIWFQMKYCCDDYVEIWYKWSRFPQEKL